MMDGNNENDGYVMIKYANLPENIMSLLPRAEDYLKAEPDILFAYLFGSLATGKPTPLSDIDIAVFLQGQGIDPVEKKMEILGHLIDLLRTDEIDLVLLNTAPLSLSGRILKNRRVIVDNAPFLRHKYESLTMRKYFDFSVREMDILKRRYLHAR